MSHSVSRLGGHGRRAGRQDTAEEAPLIRWLLIGVALLFVCAFLLVPLVIVFSSAFADGLAHDLADIEDRIESLARMKAALERLARKCRGKGPTTDCPILEELDREENGHAGG